jgi:hypothetical protein
VTAPDLSALGILDASPDKQQDQLADQEHGQKREERQENPFKHPRGDTQLLL